MSVSHKYRTFNQLLEDVTIDFSTYTLEGLVEPQQLIKVATRVNYDLGLKIHRTKEVVLDIEHGKARLPYDFAYLNYAFRCGEYTVSNTMPSGTHVETVDAATYKPAPGESGPCGDAGCNDVCVVKTCDTEYKLIQKVGSSTPSYRVYSAFMPLRIKHVNKHVCDCPNINEQAADVAEIRDGFILTSFTTGKVYISYQGAMEDNEGNLLVLDHPYCNEYYEYALKQRILENMMFNGENVSAQMGLVEQRLRAARNNALSFVNTPDFRELYEVWWKNRQAKYHKYYNMFKRNPTLR